MKRGLFKKHFSVAKGAAIATGMIIGAGILGIPYVVAKAGLLVGILQIIGLGLIMLLINLYLGEIILRTKGRHQLPGYASIYLGKTGKFLMLFALLFFQYFALIAYTFGEGQVLSFIFLGTIKFQLLFSVVFFIILSAIVFKGIKGLGKKEFWGLIAIIILVILIAIVFLPNSSMSNFACFDKELPLRLFFPYGAILFSYLGFASIPEVREEMANNTKKMKKAIILGCSIPIIIYLLFTITVVGFSGGLTPQIATISLGRITSLFAVFTMATSFLAIGVAQKEIFSYDLKINHLKSWLLTCIPVLIATFAIILYNFSNFIQIISIAGGFAGSIAGILIVLMVHKAKKFGKRKPEYKIPLNWLIAILLIALFAFGIAYQFIF